MSVKRKRVGQDEAAYDEGDSVPMPLPKQSCNPRDDDLQVVGFAHPTAFVLQ
eukprot:m.162516 g.162516  ORF g.162516 m.162516 type:complete len:52 (-) comp17666_c0_seq3:1545-1700(-)